MEANRKQTSRYSFQDMRTTEGNLLVEIDTSDGLIRENLFTATVIADTSEEHISKGDQVIVERDYVQFIDKKFTQGMRSFPKGKLNPSRTGSTFLQIETKKTRLQKVASALTSLLTSSNSKPK